MPFDPATAPETAGAYTKAVAAAAPESPSVKNVPGAPPDFSMLRPLPEARLAPVLPYQPDMLPTVLRPWLADVAERGQFHFDFLAVSAMAALGIAIGRRCAVYPKQKDDWHEYPNLWAAIIGRPGAMKSPALGAALAPLRRVEVLWSEEHARALADHKNASDRAKIERRAALAKAEQEARAGRDFEIPETAELTEPVCRRLLTSDPTEAKLGELLAQNPQGMAMELDELAALLTLFEREPSLREFFLKGWNGKEYHTIDRIGRGTLRIPAMCLSVIGGIQPGRIAPLVRSANQGAGGDGLLQRFQLIAWPDGWQDPWQNVDRWPDTAAKNEAFAVFDQLAHLTAEQFPEVAQFGPRGLRFSPEAQATFDDWHARLHAALRSAALPEALEASLAKGAKAVAGIALICELADDPGAKAIGPEALALALEWARVSESHTRRLLNCHHAAEVEAARLIWRKIEDGKLADGFSAREIKRAQWKGLGDPVAVDEALASLVECGWLRTERVVLGNGGRPSCTFIVNPKAREQFSIGHPH